MAVVGVWTIDSEVVTSVDENGNPLAEAPIATVTGYRDDETGLAWATWEAYLRSQPGYSAPAEGGDLVINQAPEVPVEEAPQVEVTE